MFHRRPRAALAMATLAVALLVKATQAQPFPATGGRDVAAGANAPAAARDCLRWPASRFDPVAQSCLCPDGMWWNLRGDACLPREHAAAELCSSAWPSSQPMFDEGGQYRCACPPPSVWDADSGVCATPPAVGGEECAQQWPGTMPVVAPSGAEFECRCPGGRRWDQAAHGCVDSAPAADVPRGVFPMPADRPPLAAPSRAPWGVPAGDAGAAVSPGVPASPGAGFSDPRASGGSNAAAAPLGGAAPPAGSPACDALISEIRGRAAAGQKAEADALGMRAAVRGCDPVAISEAVRATAPAVR